MKGPLLLVAHGFPPRSVAGTELHTWHLARHIGRELPVVVLYPQADPGLTHGALLREEQQGITTARLIQNHPYRPLERGEDPLVEAAFSRLLREHSPEVVHFQHLAGLSLHLPRLAREAGARTVMTLHDYWLLCPAGGQLAAHPDGALCKEVEPARCAVCLEAWRHREGGMEGLAWRLVAATPPPLPRDWPFRLWRRLPQPLKGVLKGINRPSPAPARPSPEPLIQRRARVEQALSCIDVVISPSNALVERARAAGLPLAAVERIPNGVPDPWSPAGVDHPPPALPGPDPSPIRVVYVGTLARHKGCDLLARASQALDPSRIQIDVFGSLETFPAYVREVRGLAGPALRLRGALAPEQVHRELARAHALVITSRWEENAPLSVLEARAVGAAVIAPRVGGLPELVRHDIDGWLYPMDDLDALVAALRRLVEEPGWLQRLRAAAEPPPTAARQARATLALYRRLLEQP